MDITRHQIGGHDFACREWGRRDNPAVLFLHGFPEYSGAWQEVAGRLEDRFFCLAPDQRGFGDSWAPGDPGAYRLQKLVADMAALIEGYGAPVDVVGHDWGAAVAYGLAAFAPTLVRRLVVMNGVHPVPFQRELAAGGAQSEASQYINFLRREGSEERLSEGDFAGLMRLFSAGMDLGWLTGARLDAYKAEWRRPGRIRGMVNWYRASPLVIADPGHPVTPPPLPEERLHIRAPHLLIWGEDDTALLPTSFKGLEAFCDGGLEIRRIAGADHWLAHQKPDEVAALIGAFLNG